MVTTSFASRLEVLFLGKKFDTLVGRYEILYPVNKMNVNKGFSFVESQFCT
jgi:hypothetical protein